MDESDNALVRVTRNVTDKIVNLLGDYFCLYIRNVLSIVAFIPMFYVYSKKRQRDSACIK